MKTDAQRVMQVLLCLQSNALKFTKDGEVEIIVDVEERGLENYLKVEVRDTGIGISKENQGKLFKMFGFLSDSQQMNKQGVGLGLVIAKQICQQFGGDIKVQSEPGVGTTFTYYFKLESIRESHQDIQSIEEKDEGFQADSKNLAFEWQPLNYVSQIKYV